MNDDCIFCKFASNAIVVSEDEDSDHRNVPESYTGVTEVPIAAGRPPAPRRAL